MALHLYNTKARTKELFEPLDPERITMYVCGPTVYNLIHIGNARPAVVFDTLFRVLRSEYPEVIYARNITDIDDKIMRAADESGESIVDISQRYALEYKKDLQQLNTLEPTLVPYATEHIPQMISMIERLLKSGHAYKADGHVLFDVYSMKNYGELSNRTPEDMLAGARVWVASYKKNGNDFVLWKPSNNGEPGWDSPFGFGRPGWHLECSAMIETHLGETIDIHGGGRDLIFPHHENEIAQSRCAHGGAEYVRYWMHNGYINIDGEKMSKSLGNFFTVRELLDKYPGEVIRFALHSAQYRSELDFSAGLLEQSRASLDSIYNALRQVVNVPADMSGDLRSTTFYKALLDDLNTPLAISELHQMARRLHREEDPEIQAKIKGDMLQAGEFIGVLRENPEAWFTQASAEGEISAEDVEALIAERQQAKLDKNYARADEVRATLSAAGIVLEDSREGTRWRRQ